MTSDELNDPSMNNRWHGFLPYIDGRGRRPLHLGAVNPVKLLNWSFSFAHLWLFLFSCASIWGGKQSKRMNLLSWRACFSFPHPCSMSGPAVIVWALMLTRHSYLGGNLLAAVWMNIWKAAANDFACVATCSVHARFEPGGFIGSFVGREGG